MFKLICSKCYDECEPTIIDFGIGAYDYGSAQENDVQEEIVSTCCEAMIYKNTHPLTEYKRKDWDKDYCSAEPDPPTYY